MLVLYNVRIILSNVREKKKEPQNVTKVKSHVMLVLHNVRMGLSNVRKNKGTTECDKNTITCDIVMLVLSNVNNGTVKYEKKIKVPQNVRKVQLNMMLVLFNVIIELYIKCEKKLGNHQM